MIAKTNAALFIIIMMLFATAPLANHGLPRIAVYVTGDVPENEKSALGTRMLSSLVNSGGYRGIERTAEFLAEIDREHIMQRSGAIDGHVRSTQVLIDAGADVNATIRDNGSTPLHMAVAGGGHIDAVKVLVNVPNVNLNAKAEGDATPLHVAIVAGQVEYVKALVSAGADIKAQAVKGHTPLHTAVTCENFEIVKCLVSGRADINAKSDAGYTPLHLAVIKGYDKIVEYLVSENTDVNTTDKERCGTPLHSAAANNIDVKIAQMLIKAGAKVNAKDFAGVTPLDLAIPNNNVKFAKALVEAGADVNSPDNKGSTPLGIAKIAAMGNPAFEAMVQCLSGDVSGFGGSR